MATTSVNTSNFLGVALIINRSRDGPAFVFHYPSIIQPVSSHPEPTESINPEDILLERLIQPANNDITGRADLTGTDRHNDDHIVTESGSQIVPWEHVAGFPARDLAGILTPARSFHKRLFQLSLDPLYCVSCPIHVPENGRWKKNKKGGRSGTSGNPDGQAAHQDADLPKVVDSSREQDKDKESDKDGHDKDPDKDAKRDDVEDEKRSSMPLFNLVFILNPKTNEVKDLVDSLYSNVIKKVVKAYKYSQQHSDFIWKESKRILAAKDRGREEQKKMSVLWREILQNSSLAASMQDLYEAVSRNKIATLHLDTAAGILTPSVQIPAPLYVADIPVDGDADQTGIWLTTANVLLSQEALEEPGFLDRNFALLLMDDEKKIITELQADQDPTALSMIEFVRLSKPTMSFHQVGQSNVLTVGQVRKYAQHFIFWRRAIAIPPLHARDVYIVSPNCNLDRLSKDNQEWQKAFPLAPPLTNFLAELSACPRPYKSYPPSKAHRQLYLRMLAWLMRGGWVTQLCTFAYVVVWPEILYEVEYAMEAEELGAAAAAATAAATTTNTIAKSAEEDERAASHESIASPNTTADESTASEEPTTKGDEAPASTAERAAEMARQERLAARASREAADKAAAHARKVVPVATAHPSINDASHLAGVTPHIILDAKKATGKESRYLSAIAARFRDDKTRLAWQSMSKYFDGRCALERIALQEDMKRKETWHLLNSMREYVLCVRHW